MTTGDNGHMAFLLRVELPDVPGSLGALATALGGAGADIEAIEIVERRPDGRVVDDVLLELPPHLMPDALILEAVERFTDEPGRAIAQLVDVIPATFRTDWALAIHRVDGAPAVMAASATAPDLVAEASDWLGLTRAKVLRAVPAWDSTVLAASPARDRRRQGFVVVVGRHGGPEFLTSEVARLGHMVSLAASVQTV
jgi:hypothetical protein